MLQKVRLIIYSFYGTLHLVVLVLSVYLDVNKNDPSFLLSIHQLIWMLKYGSLLFICLLVVLILIQTYSEKSQKRELKNQTIEIQKLKSKLYDAERVKTNPKEEQKNDQTNSEGTERST